MKFVQTMEVRTSNYDAMHKLDQEWQSATEGRRTATHVTVMKDRERADTYLWVIEFPSYEAAMRNNDLPETRDIAENMAKLADGSIAFHNFDVVDDQGL